MGVRIAMMGTRGVPARYGGFETAVEEIGSRLADRGHLVRVYCRSGGPQEGQTYRGMQLVTLPALRQRSLETLSHTGLSVCHLLAHRTDVAILFNAANAPWLPVLRMARVPVATHVDGLEWKRAKWGPTGRRYYRAAETAAVRLSDVLIADAGGIRDYYAAEYGVPARLLSYGAPILTDPRADRLGDLGLTPGGFHLVVARFEPENHVATIVSGYVRSKASRPLVVVGTAPYADRYIAQVRAVAGDDPRVVFPGAVWDQELLDQLYAHALTYLHGHSVGGTNPSLLRAIGAGTATTAYDVAFNREVLGVDGVYFRTPDDVAVAVARSEADADGELARGRRLQHRARDYDWDRVADGYEQLALDLHRRVATGPRWNARRRGVAGRAVGVPESL